ncbi:Uncharacterised protein [Streptococcus macacae NCTC 11558]|nr:Uncharacterised protein [Streptococcus macacae NCTC 11558]
MFLMTITIKDEGVGKNPKIKNFGSYSHPRTVG